MYPQTPPHFGLDFMWLYMRKRAVLYTERPTSSKMEYSHMIYRHRPLKNQLWEESFPLFLYFVMKSRFILGLGGCSREGESSERV
jgi:hypothetical protein